MNALNATLTCGLAICLLGQGLFAQSPSPLAPVPVILDPAGLNAAFKVSGAEVQALVAAGQKDAQKGKQLGDVLKPARHHPRWTRGKGKGNTDAAFVECIGLRGNEIQMAALNAARLYLNSPVPEELTKNGWYERQLGFVVSLTSEPRTKKHFGGSLSIFDGAADDVTVQKFVLSDDQGHIYNALPSTENVAVASGSETVSGTTTHRSTVTQDTTSNGSASGPAGTVFGQANQTSRFTISESVPWSEQHPYFSARYSVFFPLFDQAGKPLVTASVKTLTLHIITPNGEQSADYDLQSK